MEMKLRNGKDLPANSRIIALNTNVCDTNNMYILGEREDPGNQFAWLEQQLLEAEAKEGLVILTGHGSMQSC